VEPVEYPINGILDLHHFRPQEVADLVEEYLRACREEGIDRVRIIHGKGKGVLRRTVHSVLDRTAYVPNYHLDSGSSGSWGATIAYLDPPPST
jgi:DNA-nicking Smr family endonuclease